jgi:glycosyltransferase involved in cell wall biosynthesis
MAVASVFDPRGPDSWSGCSHHLLRSLEEDYGVSISVLGPLEISNPVHGRLESRYHRSRGRNYRPELTERSLRSFARQTEVKLKDVNCDCILALDSHTLAYLKTDLPTYYYWDCTFEGNLEYPLFAQLARPCIAAGHAMERNAIGHARMAFYSSRWAVDSAVRTYGADPKRTKIVPLAANIDCDRTEADIERLIVARSTDEVNLLFVGIDWLRKGGDLAVAVASELSRRGIRTILDVVGCEPVVDEPLPDFVRLHGFLDKRVPEQFAQLQQLAGSAHFLVVPSLAESFGAVFCEASSFGVPSLARRVGGIDSAVEEGVNGHLFDRNVGPTSYCDTIERLWRDPEEYRRLARSSFRHFTERLTWSYSAGRLLDFITDDLGRDA